MGAERIEKIKSQLIQRREEIENRIERCESGIRMSTDWPSENLEKAKKEASVRILAILGEHDLEELEAINQALSRIETGTFGICRVCRRPISLRRLETLPETTLCSKCARKLELAS